MSFFFFTFANSKPIGHLRPSTLVGNGHVPATSQDHNHGSSVSTSFVDQQLGDSNNLSRSAFSLADYDRYNAYASVAAPGNYTHATPWATSPPNDHAFGPFGNTFGAGSTADASDHDGTALPIASNPYIWGAAVPTAHSDNNTSAPLVDSNFSPLTDKTFAANASYNGGITYPTIPNAYTRVAGAPAGPMNNNTFAPFVNPNLSPLPASTFDANTAYNGGFAYSTAPNAYTGSAAAPQGPMNHYMDPGFHYPNPELPIMDAFAADTNGNCYHGQFPTALSSTTQSAATLNPPTASHPTHNIDTAPFDLAQQAQQAPPPPRPTCPTCNRSFGRQADLHRHAKKHRADAQVFRCACCGYSNYRKDKLDEHVKRSGHRAAAAVGMSLGGV